MNKRIRRAILVSSALCFIIVAPYIILYSLGYRADFENMKIVATGGIYVRTFPTAEHIIIDSKISEKPGIFNNSVFIQSLLPKDHTVLVKKEGYNDYYKTLPVLEKEVTKLENVLLIKKNISFLKMDEGASYFSVAPNGRNMLTAYADAKGTNFKYFSLSNTSEPGETLLKQSGKVNDIKWADDSSLALISLQTSKATLYFLFDSSKQAQPIAQISLLDASSKQISFNPQNPQEIFFIKNGILYSLKNSKTATIIKYAAAYAIDNGNIIWFPSGGPLNRSDISGKLLETLSSDFPAPVTNNYNRILTASGKIFIDYNGDLSVINQNSKTLEAISGYVTDMKISPDGQKLLYYSDSKISYYNIATSKSEALFSVSSGRIADCFWLNNDYIIFIDGDNITISEIDNRGNMNTVTLPGAIDIGNSKTVNIKSPKIYFDRQDNKLYILTENTLLSSEKLTP